MTVEEFCVFGIDPGPEKSGWILWDALRHRTVCCGHDENSDLLQIMSQWYDSRCHFACEKVVSYGMPVGADVFDTCYWIGRFWQLVSRRDFHLIPNAVVRQYLCRSHKAKDANVRAALIERYGPVGTKSNPGPFYGVAGHIWSAAGVAVTYAECDGVWAASRDKAVPQTVPTLTKPG